jgi:hypothetical protein
VTRVAVSGTIDRAGRTGLRLLLPLTRAACIVALAVVAWVACWLPRAAWPVGSGIRPTTRIKCNTDRNKLQSCISLNTGQSQSQLQTQLTKSNTAVGNESLGPIRDIFGGRLGSPIYYTHLYVFAGSRVARRSLNAQLAESPVPGPSLLPRSPNVRGVRPRSEDSQTAQGSGVPSHAACSSNPSVAGASKQGSNAIQLTGENNPSGRASFLLEYSSAVEQQPDKLKVVGSNPSTPTISVLGSVAQLVEQRTHNSQVAGSSPAISTIL